MLSRTLHSIRRAPVFLRSQHPAAARLSTFTKPQATNLKLPHVSYAHLPPFCRPGCGGPRPFVGVRGVASSVSNRPGSQTPGHAATNIKEEVGNAASELAKSIAGANLPIDNVKPVNDTFVRLLHSFAACRSYADQYRKLGITSAVASSVPKPVFVFGLAGMHFSFFCSVKPGNNSPTPLRA